MNFHKGRKTKDGLYKQCESCRNEQCIEKLVKMLKNYLENRDRIKDYYLDTKNLIFKEVLLFGLINYKLSLNIIIIPFTIQ